MTYRAKMIVDGEEWFMVTGEKKTRKAILRDMVERCRQLGWEVTTEYFDYHSDECEVRAIRTDGAHLQFVAIEQESDPHWDNHCQ